MRDIQATLYGNLIGTIWMLAAKCSKPVRVNLTSERDRLTPSRAGSLRHMVGQVCNDGDFQSAMLSADSFIRVEVSTYRKGGKARRVSRDIDLAQMPSIADYVSDEYADMDCEE